MLFQSSIGVDIRPDRIAVVCLQKTVKGVRLTSQSLFDLKKEDSFGERLDNFAGWFKTFLKENHTVGNGIPSIFLGIPKEMAVIKRIYLPLAAKANLYSAVRFELEKHVPLPEDEVCFDCHILSEDKTENQLYILLIITKKQDVMLFLDHLEPLGGIYGIDLSGSGLINFLDTLPDRRISNSEIFDILRNRNGAELMIDISGSKLSTPDLAPAFGLALKGLIQVPLDVNLIPPALRKKPSRSAVYIMMVLSMLVILSLLALGGSYLIRQKMTLKRLDTRVVSLSAEISELDRLRLETKEIEERLSFLHTIRQGSISALDILRELTRIIPETAWVQNLAYSDTGVQMDGYAETATELISLLEASPLFRDVVFLSSIIKDRNGKERFRIGLKINS